MFTAFIDDSGTDPAQHIAIASGLIIPSKRIPELDGEWDTFLRKQGLTKGFHAAVCVARNKHSEFSNWDDDRVSKVLARIRQIIFKYSVKAHSMSVWKSGFDSIIPNELRQFGGKEHYSWAVDHLGGFIHRWGLRNEVNIEYIFDMTNKDQRREIDVVMQHAEILNSGKFLGHYAFRSRIDHPALQCADLFAWTCYQQSQLRFRNKPLSRFARECCDDFSESDEWCEAVTALPDGLRQWVKGIYDDPQELERIRSLIK